MKRFKVRVTESARRDLRALYSYVAAHESPQRADALLDRLEAALGTLAEQPLRGTEPIELRGLGAHCMRQVICDRYRIAYRVGERDVTVRLIADGRRDLQSLLADRLLRSGEA